jgi:hypoxia up-regulated 1
MDSRDAEKTAQEESLNNLETLIYAIKNALEDDDVIAVSTEDDRTSLSAKVLAAQEWLEDIGYTAKTPEIDIQQRILDVDWSPIALRRKEAVERPQAVEALVKEIEATRALVVETVANQTKSENSDVKVYLETPPGHLETIKEHLDHIDAWLKEKVKEQETKAAFDPPAFLSEECMGKKSGIKAAYKTFSKSKKWKYLPVDTTSSTTTTTTTTTAAEESGSVEEEVVVDAPVKEDGGSNEEEVKVPEGEKEEEVKIEEKEEVKVEEKDEVKLAEETPSDAGDRDQDDL